MKRAINWIVGILLLVSLLFNGYMFYLSYHSAPPEVIEIHDTTIIRKDSIIEKTLYKTKYDTIISIQFVDTSSNDTMNIVDTVEIPIEHKVDSFTLNKDSLSVTEKIYHSGFHSTIDSILFSYDWLFTVLPKKQRKVGLVWNLGFYGGYGINFNNGQYYFSPEVGVGVSIGIGGLIY